LGGSVALLLLIPYQIGKRLIGRRSIAFPPSTMPYIALSMMALFSAVWLILLLRSKNDEKEQADSSLISSGESIVRVSITFFILCLGAIFINRIGFISTSFFLTVLLLFYYGVRSWKMLLSISAAISLFTYAFFKLFMKIPLPAGILF